MTEWLAQYEEDGETFFRIGRDRGGHELVAEWLGIARLVAQRDGSSHRVDVDPDADPRELAKITRGGIALLLRHLAGKMALHGAAVVRGGRAAVLLGRAGHGKSTLAAALCAHDEVALLADDAVAIDMAPDGSTFVATATEPQHWLDAAARHEVARMTGAMDDDGVDEIDEDEGDADEDETDEGEGETASVAGAAGAQRRRGGKLPVAARRVGREGAIVAIVDLAFHDAPPRIVRATPLEAMTALVPQTVRFVLDDPAVFRREMDALHRLVDTVPFFRLERPRDLALLSQSCDLVHTLLRGPPAAPPDDP